MEAVFASALPLGMESVGEVLEIQFEEPIAPEQAKAQLQQALPEGMQLLDGYTPVHKMGELAYVQYRVTLPCTEPENLLAKWQLFLQQPSCLIEKKTKRGVRTVDLLPQIDCRSAEAQTQALQFVWMLSIGQPESVNPMLILQAFCDFAGCEAENPAICRLQLYTKEKTEFF
jgi:radical SAM-linked protein